MAQDLPTAEVEAAKELTIEVVKKVALPADDYKGVAERVGEIYKIIFRAVEKPRED